MLCWAVQARAEDIDEEEWLDKEGNPLRADRWWHASSMEEAGDSHGPCMGMQVNIWERAKYRRYMQHFLVGCGKHAGGYGALNHQAILHGEAGKLGKLDILSVLPEKVAIFLYEYHDFRLSAWDCLAFQTTGADSVCMTPCSQTRHENQPIVVAF